MGKKQKIIKPPQLPPEPTEDEIEISDEDVEFFEKNPKAARFFKKLDTEQINREVSRVAGAEDDTVEARFEKSKLKETLQKEREERGLEVDRVDALPVKIDGKFVFRTAPKATKASENSTNGDQNEEDGEDKSFFKMSKAEKRAKLKKLKKESKKQGKETVDREEVQQTPQAKVVAEVAKELTAEETKERKKYKLAEIGTSLLSDPESNIKFIKEMLDISKDGDHEIAVLGLKSLLAVFKDIIPGYRIRMPTEKEQEMVVSKAVKKMRFYESTLLTTYKAYLQRLVALEKQDSFKHVAVRCICTLLAAVPHFNFRDSLLVAVIKNLSSPDDVVRKLCCATVKSLFTNEGKHGGEATVEAVQLIAEHVKIQDCQLHPDSVEVFMSLSFDEDLRRAEMLKKDSYSKNKKNKKRKNVEETKQVQENDRKKNKKELMSRTRDEVNADFMAASLAQDVNERKRIQSETLSALFETYFRILKQTVQLVLARSEGPPSSSSGGHPLLCPCLSGIGKFAHLIDLDYMGDLINYLRKLAGSGSKPDGCKPLTVSERLQCCIVAFQVMKNNLDALNVDLQDFFVQLYSIILEYRPGRDKGEVLAEALKIMLCDSRQHDMQRAAAFIKRLATFSLCFGSAESMAALVTVKHLLQKNVKCQNLLENDAGGGSVSGTVARYQPYALDPNHSGALATVLWELNLLSKHYHPSVSTIASTISTMNTSSGQQVYHAITTPQQAFMELSLEKESFNPKGSLGKLNQKKQKIDLLSSASDISMEDLSEDVVKKKLSEHFTLLRNMGESKRLKSEMARTSSALQLYTKFKKEKRVKESGSKPKKVRKS